MEKPEMKTGGKTRPQQIINGAYNQGLQAGLAYHEARVKGVVEVYRDIKGSPYEQYLLSIKGKSMEEIMWQAIKTLAEGESKKRLPKPILEGNYAEGEVG